MKFDYEGIKTSTFLYFTESGVAVLFLLRFSGLFSSASTSACCWADFKHSWKRWDPTTAGLCPIMHWARKTAGWVASLSKICRQIIKKKKKTFHTFISHTSGAGSHQDSEAASVDALNRGQRVGPADRRAWQSFVRGVSSHPSHPPSLLHLINCQVIKCSERPANPARREQEI